MGVVGSDVKSDLFVFYGLERLLTDFCCLDFKKLFISQTSSEVFCLKMNFQGSNPFVVSLSLITFYQIFEPPHFHQKVANSYSKTSANERVVYGMKTKTRSHKSFLITLLSFSFLLLAPQLKTKII